MRIEPISNNTLQSAIDIWNEVVEDGVAFPQTDLLTESTGKEFFMAQSFTGVLIDGERVVGMYILHPNNVGRCGHIANSSYCVKKGERGKGYGRKLVSHSLVKGKELGFKILQFNAVVKSNTTALKLYESLGFVRLGTIPNGFLKKDGTYEDIIPHYHTL